MVFKCEFFFFFRNRVFIKVKKKWSNDVLIPCVSLFFFFFSFSSSFWNFTFYKYINVLLMQLKNNCPKIMGFLLAKNMTLPIWQDGFKWVEKKQYAPCRSSFKKRVHNNSEDLPQVLTATSGHEISKLKHLHFLFTNCEFYKIWNALWRMFSQSTDCH